MKVYFAFIGHAELARGPVEEPNAQPVLQLRYLFTDRRWRAVEISRGGGETAFADHFDKARHFTR